MRSVDLNCDCGESFGAYRMGDDEAMLDIVTSANVACGLRGRSGYHGANLPARQSQGRCRRRASELSRSTRLRPPPPALRE